MKSREDVVSIIGEITNRTRLEVLAPKRQLFQRRKQSDVLHIIEIGDGIATQGQIFEIRESGERRMSKCGDEIIL